MLRLASCASIVLGASAAVSCAAGIADGSSPLGVRAEVRYGEDAQQCLDALSPLQPWFAWALFNDTVGAVGFATLNAATNATVDDTRAAAAAGACEGALTARRIDELADNFHGGVAPYSPSLAEFVRANSEWVRAKASALRMTDPFWHQVYLLYAHLDGLIVGAHAAGARSSADTIYALTLAGDLDDLCVALGCTGSSRANRPRGGHCSVLVKAVGGVGGSPYTDVLASHTTWSTLESMTRIWKQQSFPFALTSAPDAQQACSSALGAPRAAVGSSIGWAYATDELADAAASGAIVPGAVMSFSSYPGILYSFDDFYTTAPARLMVTETTIINNNASLWGRLSPASVLDWARNMAANRLADSGPAWMATFGRNNSGTYNNMFSVLDGKLFTPGVTTTLPAGLLLVGEQMPGAWVFEDRTSWLVDAGGADGPGQGYWASYNRPSFPEIFALSNQSALVAAYGDHFSWSKTARANIFRARQATVVDEASLRALMRYNAFTTDPLSEQGCQPGASSASNAIAERGDLTPTGARGDCCVECGLTQHDEVAIDCKTTSASRLREPDGPTSSFVSGPPTDAQLPPFRWSTSPFAASPHRGQPDLWNFAWVEVA